MRERDGGGEERRRKEEKIRPGRNEKECNKLAVRLFSTCIKTSSGDGRLEKYWPTPSSTYFFFISPSCFLLLARCWLESWSSTLRTSFAIALPAARTTRNPVDIVPLGRLRSRARADSVRSELAGHTCAHVCANETHTTPSRCGMPRAALDDPRENYVRPNQPRCERAHLNSLTPTILQTWPRHSPGQPREPDNVDLYRSVFFFFFLSDDTPLNSEKFLSSELSFYFLLSIFSERSSDV